MGHVLLRTLGRRVFLPFLSLGAHGKLTRGFATVRPSPPVGAFSPYPNHDPNVHTTLSAVQILAMQDSLDILDRDKIVNCTSVMATQTPREGQGD